MPGVEDPAVTNFRNYVRINTIQPSPDYAACTNFLMQQAKEIGLEVYVEECVPGKPVVILTLQGEDPSLPSLLLNSHTDVVPVFPDKWKYEPLSAHKDEKGDIYGRGTQDMKCVAIQYLEAVRRLKARGKKFLRTIHFSFVPDEEISGADGMAKFVKTKKFQKMNVGFSMDEGLANPGEEFMVYYGERNPWWVWVRCPGQPGHGSQFLKNTAGEKIHKVVEKFLSFRDSEEQRLKDDPKIRLGDVTTVNFTMMEGGVQFNVVPAEMCVGFDVRIPPTVDLKKFEATILKWCSDISEDIVVEFKNKMLCQNVTALDDSNPWWTEFSTVCKEEKLSITKTIFPAATDSRFIREVGISALGFSPMNHTPVLLHDHNEYLNEKVFLRGIEIYEKIIPRLANLKAA